MKFAYSPLVGASRVGVAGAVNRQRSKVHARLEGERTLLLLAETAQLQFPAARLESASVVLVSPGLFEREEPWEALRVYLTGPLPQ